MGRPRKSKVAIPVGLQTHTKAREDDFVAKGHLTKHLTGNQFEVIRERTRINSWEELDYVTWKEMCAEDLGVPLYKLTITIHHGSKISKDGESRKEDVDAIYGFQDEYGEGRKATGLRRVSDALIERRRSNEQT